MADDQTASDIPPTWALSLAGFLVSPVSSSDTTDKPETPTVTIQPQTSELENTARRNSSTESQDESAATAPSNEHGHGQGVNISQEGASIEARLAGTY